MGCQWTGPGNGCTAVDPSRCRAVWPICTSKCLCCVNQNAGENPEVEFVWLPETYTDPNMLLEKPGWPQFSRLLTEAEAIESKDCGDGIFGQLVHNGHHVEMRGDSMRKNRGKQSNP
jgi:hypothetical protein